ncbi:peptidoglycan DD-metalloendopeptidase family protein [Pontixanthobacter gangjinensis]|uniref:Peptidoglycan DD-metalloendopeptidase family protein n=1 Tax=Pontixanthobacter gangjinensis TaxID=1028742 RepID=A0A6I4SJP8_9SPHN|nr:peptidoglycan DD-metalloendopeptidase family protein [Pontixanthobacter gangjinensis]MXO55658.1 peptidoglycan DD-metalloendopeptidase family protein [Pontixanthobacter gangjinensis]
MRYFKSLLAATLALPLLVGTIAFAQREAVFDDSSDSRAALSRALAESKEAEARGAKLEAEARSATQAAEKTATEAAALAARIQQAEAGIAAAEARISLISGERATLSRRLAQRRGPLIRLTGALQKLARRPLALSALRPGSLRETVYLRALLESTIPQVRKRTAALRSEIDRGRALELEANQALAALKRSETQLAERQKRLAGLETRQRLISRQASGDADRESERALALAEEARDLDNLVERLDAAGSLRKELAALPGPTMRPARPQNSIAKVDVPSPASSATAPGASFQLPVTGRTVAGFGESTSGGVRNTGLSLSPRAGAQVIAPAEGRVAFAGPYRGYERIVILEHPGGWTSLITGLARNDVEVGDDLVAGSPLGVAGVDAPLVTLELRRDGTPVNPLQFIQ